MPIDEKQLEYLLRLAVSALRASDLERTAARYVLMTWSRNDAQKVKSALEAAMQNPAIVERATAQYDSFLDSLPRLIAEGSANQLSEFLRLWSPETDKPN